MIVVMTIGESYGLQIHIYMQIISDTVSCSLCIVKK